MNCTVNLVPASCLDSSIRARHRAVWGAVLLGTSTLFVAAWVALEVDSGSRARIEERLGETAAAQTNIDRELLIALGERTARVSEARIEVGVIQRDRLAERLSDLATAVPEGVLLTRINGVEVTEEGAPGGRHAPARAGAAATAGANASLSPAAEDLSVSLHGFAVQHSDLALLIAALERADGWREVELVRSAREPHDAGFAVAFELHALVTEALP